MEKNTEIIRKKILFRSWHRGTKEMDLILGTYADNNLSLMSNDDLMHFQNFLNLSDPDLYKWLISEEKGFPDEFKDLIEDIIKAVSYTHLTLPTTPYV